MFLGLCKCLLSLFLSIKLFDKYQSCHPWYPQMAMLSFPEYALANLLQSNLTLLLFLQILLCQQGCGSINFCAKSASSLQFKVDIFPYNILLTALSTTLFESQDICSNTHKGHINISIIIIVFNLATFCRFKICRPKIG